MALSIYGYIAGPWTDMLARARARRGEEYGPISILGPMVLHRFAAEIGNGEEGGNNRGPHIRRWRRGPDGVNWCAVVIAYQLEEVVEAILRPGSGATAAQLEAARKLEPLLRHKRWPRWRLSAKALAREIGKVGCWVKHPLPGDLVLYERGKDGDWKGHIEDDEEVELAGDGLVTIAGNVGRYPAKVRRLKRRIGHDRMIGFVRLP